MAPFNLTVAVAVLCSVMVLVSEAAESRFLGKVKAADMPVPSALSESVARELITEWGQWVISGNYTGDQISGKFFFPEAVLRGTVSAMTRTQLGAKANTFTEATLPADLKELTIGQYFNYFNGNNLKGMSATWNDDNDYVIRVSTDALLCNLFKKFDLPGATVVAVMSFVVKQKDGDTKILSLHSSPLFMTPPEALHETILDSAEPMATSSSPAMKVDALTQSTAYSSGSELSEDTARLLIEKWGESVVSGHFSGEEIAQEFFFSDAILRGTVSAMTRTQSGARSNTFAEVTPPAKLEDLTIGQYFEYFNGANLKDMSVQWDNGNDFMLRISSDALQCNLFKKFEIDGGEVVAVMTFVVKQRQGEVKILSLHSSPLHCGPPSALHETVLWNGCGAVDTTANSDAEIAGAAVDAAADNAQEQEETSLQHRSSRGESFLPTVDSMTRSSLGESSLPTIDSMTGCDSSGHCPHCNSPGEGKEDTVSYPPGSYSCKPNGGCMTWWPKNGLAPYVTACVDSMR